MLGSAAVAAVVAIAVSAVFYNSRRAHDYYRHFG